MRSWCDALLTTSARTILSRAVRVSRKLLRLKCRYTRVKSYFGDAMLVTGYVCVLCVRTPRARAGDAGTSSRSRFIGCDLTACLEFKLAVVLLDLGFRERR